LAVASDPLGLASGGFDGSVLADAAVVVGDGGSGGGAAEADATGVFVGWGRSVASGRSTTTTSSVPASVLAIATALCFVGEARIVLGAPAKTVPSWVPSRTGQSALSVAGQTSSTLRLITVPGRSFETYPTASGSTAMGVSAAMAGRETAGLAPAPPPATGLSSPLTPPVGPNCRVAARRPQRPQNNTAIPPANAPSGRLRRTLLSRFCPPPRLAASIAADVRAHKSRGGSGGWSRGDRSACRSAPDS